MENKIATFRPLIALFTPAALPEDRRFGKAAFAFGKAVGEEGFDLVVDHITGLSRIAALTALSAKARVTEICLSRDLAQEGARDEPLRKDINVKLARDAGDQFEQIMLNKLSMPVAAVVLSNGGFDDTLEKAVRVMSLAARGSGPPMVLVPVDKRMNGLAQYFLQAVQSGDIRHPQSNGLRSWMPGESLRALNLVVENPPTLSNPRASMHSIIVQEDEVEVPTTVLNPRPF